MAPRERRKNGKVIYTDSDRTRAYLALIETGMDRETCEGGVINKVATGLTIPYMTLKDWRTSWQVEGPPEVDLGEENATSLKEVERIDDLIERTLIQIEREIPQTKDVAKLSGLVKTLFERRSIIKGETTSKTEVKLALPTREEFMELLAPLASYTIAEARVRAQEIIDVTSEEIVVTAEEQAIIRLPAKT